MRSSQFFSYLLRAGGVLLVGLAILLTPATAAPPRGSLGEDEAEIARLIKTLASPDSEVRAAAATTLRNIVGRYPSGTANIRDKDAGEAAWLKKIDELKPGATKLEVLKVLPKFAECPECFAAGSGGTHGELYRIDWDWLVEAQYYNSDKLIQAPALRRREARVYVAPPDNFTGDWVTWHVNGQVARRAQYETGKYHGKLTVFHDNGSISYEQHYTQGVADGMDSGWDPDGRLMYLGQFRHGKQHGPWIHWYANGLKRHERNYVDGIENGLCARWYEDGQMQYEKHLQNGLAHGLEASWNENGELLYKRNNRQGQLVE